MAIDRPVRSNDPMISRATPSDEPRAGCSSEALGTLTSWCIAVVIAVTTLLLVGSFSRAVQIGQRTMKYKTLVSEAFLLRGPNAKSTAMLTQDPAGQTVLRFWDLNGFSSLGMGLFERGWPTIS